MCHFVPIPLRSAVLHADLLFFRSCFRSCVINTLLKQPWRHVRLCCTYPLRFTYLIGSGYSSLSVWTGVFGSKAGSFVESITTVNQSDKTLPGRVCQFQLWNPLPWWALRCMLFPFVHQGPGPATVLHFLMFRVLRGLIVFSFFINITVQTSSSNHHEILQIGFSSPQYCFSLHPPS